MQPTTLRLSEDLIEALDEEAEEAGFSSRSEYIRYLLTHRDTIRQDSSSDTGPNTSDTAMPNEVTTELSSLADRLEAVEAQVTDLEDEVEAVQAHVDHGDVSGETSKARSSDTGETEITSHTTDEETSADSADDEQGQEDTFAVLEDWLEANGPESDVAQAILLDAARILDEHGQLSTSELQETLYEKYPDGYGSAKGLWSATVNRWYEEIPGFEKRGYGKYGFNVDEVPERL
jgi:Arc/MetJ-type ribon-helix-helix transcriptional regulator